MWLVVLIIIYSLSESSKTISKPITTTVLIIRTLNRSVELWEVVNAHQHQINAPAMITIFDSNMRSFLLSLLFFAIIYKLLASRHYPYEKRDSRGACVPQDWIAQGNQLRRSRLPLSTHNWGLKSRDLVHIFKSSGTHSNYIKMASFGKFTFFSVHNTYCRSISWKRFLMIP